MKVEWIKELKGYNVKTVQPLKQLMSKARQIRGEAPGRGGNLAGAVEPADVAAPGDGRAPQRGAAFTPLHLARTGWVRCVVSQSVIRTVKRAEARAPAPPRPPLVSAARELAERRSVTGFGRALASWVGGPVPARASRITVRPKPTASRRSCASAATKHRSRTGSRPRFFLCQPPEGAPAFNPFNLFNQLTNQPTPWTYFLTRTRTWITRITNRI
jgi:hypothetical protein